jgi:hypothetical protein
MFSCKVSDPGDVDKGGIWPLQWKTAAEKSLSATIQKVERIF